MGRDSTALNSEPSTGLSDSMSLMMGGSSETAVSPPLPPGGLMRIVWVFLVRIISSSITPASTVSRRESEHREARGSCTRTSSAELVAAAPRLPHTSSSPASGGRIKRHDAVCKTLADHLRARKMSDLLVEHNGRGFIVDAQIVSGALSLDDSDKRRVEKYNSPPVKEAAAKLLNIKPSDVQSFTIMFTIFYADVFSIKPIQLIYYHDNFTVKDTVDCTSAARCSQCR
ncbi:hypothetical protein PV328_012020 [Microctonus aethiopoides]|uniref:Uncharacterized protein n=1 Tax=Microctonus aethiopoides TaxID=144406 RepID=A0AA39EWY8_9HYME|nr:hypothetical protein PV328_012020 [Microctonus aethiopoides]